MKKEATATVLETSSEVQNISSLYVERELLTCQILKRNASDKPLGYQIVALSSEMAKGNIGSQLPRNLRTRSMVAFIARKFAEKYGRQITLDELLGAVCSGNLG